MSADETSSTVLRGIRPSDLEAYLQGLMWRREAAHPLFAAWHVPDLERRILVPTSDELDDYVDRMEEVLSLVQRVHHLSREQILHGIEETASDTLRLRAEWQSGADAPWTTSLAEGRRLLDVAHGAWSDSAREIVRAERDEKKKRDRVQAFMDSLRLGQTERGSFILRVLAPVPVLDHRQVSIATLPTPPIERRITQRMFRAIRTLADTATEATKLTPSRVREIFVASSRDGVTSSLCQNLASAVSSEKMDAIDLTLSFARHLPPDGAPQETVRFGSNLRAALEAGADTLRRVEPSPRFAIEGWIVKVRRGPSDELSVVTIFAVIGAGARHVLVRLGEEDTNTALEAMGGRRAVRCEGRLVREGKQFEVVDPTGFRMLSEPEQLAFEGNESFETNG